MYWDHIHTHLFALTNSCSLIHSLARTQYLLLCAFAWFIVLGSFVLLFSLLCPSKLWFGICRATVHIQSLSCLFLCTCVCFYFARAVFKLRPVWSSLHTRRCFLLLLSFQLNSVFTIFNAIVFGLFTVWSITRYSGDDHLKLSRFFSSISMIYAIWHVVQCTDYRISFARSLSDDNCFFKK